MHVLIFGGSGKSGRLVISTLVQHNHTVTALVRNPASLPAGLQNNANIALVQGNLTQPDIERAFQTPRRPDAVIVTLAQLLKTGNPFSALIGPRWLMADTHSIILAAMEKFDVKRIVTMSAFGAGDSFANLSFMLKGLFRYSNMLYQFEDHDEVDRRIKAAKKERSALEFVLARPVMLVEGPSKAVKDHGDQGKGVGVMDKISRQSVAVFLIEAVEKHTWVGRTPVMTN